MSYTANQIITHAIKLFDEQADNKGKFDQDTSLTFLLELFNDGYKEIVRKSKCSRTTGSFATTSDITEYQITSSDRYPGFVSLKRATYTDSNGLLRVLERKSGDYIQELNITGYPFYYYQEEDIIGIGPLPNGAYTIDITFYQQPTTDLELDEYPSLIPATWQRSLLSKYLVWKMFVIDKGEGNNKTVQWENLYYSSLSDFSEFYKEGMNDDVDLSI
jgi:hypothetical protein